MNSNFKLVLLIAFLTFGISSCDDETNISNNKDLLVGFWVREHILINDVHIDDYVPGSCNANFLEIRNDNTYQIAYTFGEWELIGNRLKIQSQHNVAVKNYTIEELTLDRLLIKTRITDVQIGFDIPDFSNNQILTVVEVYKRSE